jgi:ubiquinone/menaquinone biosynthesis C-methylase UbiE
MGLYRDQIFPRLMDWIMAGEEFRLLRAALLQSVGGEVLELGIGTGLNLLHYPAAVTRLHAVDPGLPLPKKLAERSGRCSFPVQLEQVTAESLPHADRVFDWVVSTWTLCTIPDPVQALREVGRVLKPTGAFLFLEHGRSTDRTTALWQDWLNPVQNLVGCGCNLNRPIDQLIGQAGLHIATLDRFRMESVPRIGGEMYRGLATRRG